VPDALAGDLVRRYRAQTKIAGQSRRSRVFRGQRPMAEMRAAMLDAGELAQAGSGAKVAEMACDRGGKNTDVMGENSRYKTRPR
jgi:hypothetical protein